MNPLLIMELKKGRFTKNDNKIYQVIKEDPEVVTRNNIIALSDLCKVSQPSITRFAQKLGFEKYTDFKFEMYKYARAKSNETWKEEEQKIPAMQGYQQLMKEIDGFLTIDLLQEILPYLMNAKHIFTTGIQQSFLSAKLLEYNLQKLGIYCMAVNWDGLSSLPSMQHEDDLTIIFSVRAGSLSFVFDEQNEKQKGKFLLITMNAEHPYQQQINQTICLPPAVRKDYSLRLESQVVFMTFIDILSSYLALQLA